MTFSIKEELSTESGTLVSAFSINDTNPESKTLIYTIDKDAKLITVYPKNIRHSFFDRVYIEGFIKVPDIFNSRGFIKNKVLYYIHKHFEGRKIVKVVIRNGRKSEISGSGLNKTLYLNYQTIKKICNDLGSMNSSHQSQKSLVVSKLLHTEFPRIVTFKDKGSSNAKVKNALAVLSTQKSESFEKADISTISEILSNLMKSRYKSTLLKKDLFKTTKLKFDTVTFDSVIEEFDNNLKSKVSESKWGQFLEDNLFIIDSKYIHCLPELNLVLGGTRKVDFGLVDVYGYLDIFEIKKPDTPLLDVNKDRGNFVWHKQAIQAVVQAEKYLHHAERKSANLKEDIKRERDINIDVIRPRAYVIMGNSTELDTDPKKEDFRILRSQFKHIEIVLYDELLERIKNQKKALIR